MKNPGDSTRRLRVLHGITHLALGGAEQVAFTLMRGLKGKFDFGVFAVMAPDPGEFGRALRDELTDLGVPLLSAGSAIPFKAGGLPLAALRLARARRVFRPDIIQLHTEIPEATAALLAPRQAGSAQVLLRTIHNSVYWDFWPRVGRWTDRRLSAAHIAGVSQGALDAFTALRTASGAPPPPAPPILIPNGVEVPAGIPAAARPPDAPLRLLFAGRFEPQKGTDLLPAILAAVRLPAGSRGELTVYGSGAQAGLLHALADAPPAGWTVRILSPVPQLARRLTDFDAVLMPSRYEGVGLVALEAMLLGVPLVATDAPGLREQLPPEYPWRAKAGDNVDFARQLQRLLDEPDRRRETALRTRTLAEVRFGAGAMCQAYASLYRRIAPGLRSNSAPC